MASADLLSKIHDELDARLRELRPVVEEYENLLAAAAALELAGEEEGVASTTSKGAAPARRRGRRPGKRSAGRSPVTPKPAAAASTTAGSSPRVTKKPTSPRRAAAAPKRAQRGTAAVAILAALGHGSHTVSELTVVTAISSQAVNSNLRRLQQAGTITRTKREGDGKAAYALTATPA